MTLWGSSEVQFDLPLHPSACCLGAPQGGLRSLGSVCLELHCPCGKEGGLVSREDLSLETVCPTCRNGFHKANVEKEAGKCCLSYIDSPRHSEICLATQAGGWKDGLLIVCNHGHQPGPWRRPSVSTGDPFSWQRLIYPLPFQDSNIGPGSPESLLIPALSLVVPLALCRQTGWVEQDRSQEPNSMPLTMDVLRTHGSRWLVRA